MELAEEARNGFSVLRSVETTVFPAKRHIPDYISYSKWSVISLHRDGSGQWKTWERPMEEMGAYSGKDGSDQWKRWERLMEKSRVSGVPRWERAMEATQSFSCKWQYPTEECSRFFRSRM